MFKKLLIAGALLLMLLLGVVIVPMGKVHASCGWINGVQQKTVGNQHLFTGQQFSIYIRNDYNNCDGSYRSYGSLSSIHDDFPYGYTLQVSTQSEYSSSTVGRFSVTDAQTGRRYFFAGGTTGAILPINVYIQGTVSLYDPSNRLVNQQVLYHPF